MVTSLFVQGVGGLLVLSAVAALFVGAAISFVMKCSAGPHQEPFWLAAVISASSGATIASVAHVLAETSGSIWAVMAIGAACGILGAWGTLHFDSLCEKHAPPTRDTGGKNRAAFQSAREPWRVPRADCRAVFSTPDIQKRKLFACRQEAA